MHFAEAIRKGDRVIGSPALPPQQSVFATALGVRAPSFNGDRHIDQSPCNKNALLASYCA